MPCHVAAHGHDCRSSPFARSGLVGQHLHAELGSADDGLQAGQPLPWPALLGTPEPLDAWPSADAPVSLTLSALALRQQALPQ
jgi:hypothetical protein